MGSKLTPWYGYSNFFHGTGAGLIQGLVKLQHIKVFAYFTFVIVLLIPFPSRPTHKVNLVN
jgi:hypothetical protein